MVVTVFRFPLALALACSIPAFAFQNRGPITPRLRPDSVPAAAADLHVDVPLVLIPVHVTTPLGATVNSLQKENFHLYEDNVEQKITHFANEDAPLSIGLLFDESGSMRNKIHKSCEAAAAFFKTANLDDEFFLIEFNDRAKLAVPFTRDAEMLYKRLVHSRPEGHTSLIDAVHLAMVQMKNAKHVRKALVILSDGGDNRSRYTETELMSALREADVQVYAMGIFDPDDVPKRTVEERNGPQLLDALALETGGRHFPVRDLNDLPRVCERIGNDLRNQYVLGYAPTNKSVDPAYRHVKVTVDPPAAMPPMRAHHRQGYYPGVVQ